MAEEKAQVRRGRGAALMDALQKAQERPGPSLSQTQQQEPVKPRGRAALLEKLADIRQSRIGSGCGDASSTQIGSSDAISSVTKAMSTTSISEPKSYQGTKGTQISAACNYIRLSIEPDKGIFEYRVDFDDVVDSKSIRRKLVNQHAGKVRNFDGGNVLYLPVMLPDTVTEFQCAHPTNDTPITMTFTFVKKKRMGQCLHMLNVLFKKVMSALLYSPIGKNYFDPNHACIIPQHKLEILPGYAVAVEEYEGGLMVCLDTLHRVMRTQCVYDCLVELKHIWQANFKKVAMQSLVGSTVMTRYNNKSYRINDIIWDANPRSTFNTHDGRTISYEEYYKKQYDITIKDLEQPLLLHMQTIKQPGLQQKMEKFVCLIPELCFMTGLTDDMRTNFKLMKDVAMYTNVTPNQRINALHNYLNNIEKTPKAKQALSDWGLKIENATVDILARVLNPEVILFGGGILTTHNADWTNACTRNKVLSAVHFDNWVVFYTQRDQRSAEEFVNITLRVCEPMGMQVSKPIMYLLKDDRTETYLTTIKNVISSEIQIFVFICPTSRDDRYSAIKKLCCGQMPIATQVINSRTLANPKRVRSVVQKIALQMNCKLGGALWSVRLPFVNWMICGVDVYHSPGSNSSVCAFVCSLDESVTRWWSAAVFQDRELGDQFKIIFSKALEKYHDINGHFPTNVVLFRDGVGDSQLKDCLEYEINQFQRVVSEIKSCNIKLTVVIVQKRINTRLFLQAGRNEFDNPPPGTIVDREITKRNWYDFFLVAQQARQRTVTPTHYIVLYDSANLKPDHVQQLAFKLCHLYYNWSGTIRVPAPCQYAHKLAYLVGQHIHKPPSVVLEDRLFYL